MKLRSLLALPLLLLALVVSACGGDAEPSEGGGQSAGAGAGTTQSTTGAEAGGLIQPIAGAADKPEITVGSKNFTEQYVLGEIYAQALEAAGFRVDKSLDIGSELLAYAALRRGRIDAYPEYTGTALTSFFDVPIADVPRDPTDAFEQAKADYAEEGITALPPAPFNSTYVIIVPKSLSAELGNPTKISDLRPNASKLRIAALPECRQRTDCLLGVERVYDMDFEGFVGTANYYQALRAGGTDISFAVSTDGELSSGDYVVLQDDRRVFPPYSPTLTMRDAAAREIGPEGQAVVERVQKGLTEPIMQELNARVAIDKQTPEQAAKEYLQAAGLIEQ